MTRDEILTEAKLALRRAAQKNLQEVGTTEAERERLRIAVPPVTAPLAQDYLVWRKAMLLLAAVALLAMSVIELATYESSESQLGGRGSDAVEAFGVSNLEIVDATRLILIGSVIVSALLALGAVRFWPDVRRSRHLARSAFLVQFLTPFALALLPLLDMMDFGHLDQAVRQGQITAEQKTSFLALLGVMLGLQAFLLIGPRAIALIPGVIRSAMALKTLLPESPMPGWVTVIVAPLYAIFLVVVISLVNQMYGNFLLLAGVACLIIAPLVYIYWGKVILRPHRPDEVGRMVLQVRRQGVLFTLAGAVLLSIFLLDKVPEFGVGDLLEFLVTVLGNVLLLTVVGTDFFLALVTAAQRQEEAFVGSDLGKALDEKLDALSEAGLTEIRTKPKKGKGK